MRVVSIAAVGISMFLAVSVSALYGVRVDDSYCQHNTIMNETYRGVTSSAISDAGTSTVSWHVMNDGVDVRPIATSPPAPR